MPTEPFAELSWPPKPAITRGLIFVRVLLFINNLVTCVIALVCSHAFVVGAIGVFAAISLPFVLIQIYLHFRMLPSTKKRNQGLRYSALGIRGEADQDHNEPTYPDAKTRKALELQIVLGLDLLGWFTFLLTYSFAESYLSGNRYYDLIAMTYACVGALVAFVIHAYCIIIEVRLLITRRNSFKRRCPHCSHIVRSPLPEASEGSVRLPDQETYLDEPVPALRNQGTPTSGQSAAASEHEAEAQNLINKA